MAAVRELVLDLVERKSGNGLTDAANDLEKLSRGVDAGTDKMKEMEQGSKRLETEIAKTTARIKDLRIQAAHTGDESLFGDIRKEEARLKSLTKTFDALAEDAAQAGKDAGKAFTGNFSSSLQGMESTPGIGPVFIAGLVAMALLAAPTLGAAIAGAVTGAAGLGGIAGGIFAASKDQNVRDAASSFGHWFSSMFFSSGTSFVEPIVESLDILKRDFAQLDLAGVFAAVAPYVTEFAHGIGGLAMEFMPHFKAALVAAGPALAEFAHDLPLFGQALGEMFESIANSRGTIEGIKVLFNVVDNTIKILGVSIAFLGDAFDKMLAPMQFVIGGLAKLGDALGWVIGKDNFVTKFFDKYLAGIEKLRYGNDYGAISFGAIGKSVENFLGPAAQAQRAAEAMASALKTMNDEFDQWINKSLAIDDANIAVAQGFLNLSKELGHGKQDWRDNTQAGLDHQKMLLDQIGAIQRQRDATVAAAGDNKAAIDAANKKYQEQLDKLLAMAAAAGASKAQLQALAGKYDVEVFYHLHSEGSGPSGLSAEIKSIVGKRAAGGPVMAGQPYVVGENRPELFVPSSNGYIMPSVPSSGAGGGMNLTLNLGGAPTGALDGMFVQWLMQALTAAIRAQGGQLSVLGLKPA